MSHGGINHGFINMLKVFSTSPQVKNLYLYGSIFYVIIVPFSGLSNPWYLLVIIHCSGETFFLKWYKFYFNCFFLHFYWNIEILIGCCLDGYYPPNLHFWNLPLRLVFALWLSLSRWIIYLLKNSLLLSPPCLLIFKLVLHFKSFTGVSRYRSSHQRLGKTNWCCRRNFWCISHISVFI